MSWPEILNKLLAIVISVLILYNGYVIKKRTGSWFSPGAIICVFWFCYTFFPLVLLFQLPINSLSICYIALGVLLFSWTHLLFNWKKQLNKNANQEFWLSKINDKYVLYIIAIFVIISIIFSISFLNFQEINLLDYFFKPIQEAESLAKKRYSKSLVKTNYNALSFVFSHLAVLFGGTIYYQLKSKSRRALVFICFIPSFFILITQSAKGLFFLSIFIFLGGLIVTRKQGVSMQYLKKNIKKIVLVAVFIPLLLVFSFLSRGFNNNMSFDGFFFKLKHLFSSYILAHIYSFSDWFTAYIGGVATLDYNVSNNYYGFYTFNSITRYVSDKNINVRGVYSEYFRFEDVIQTNVYTVFRGLIMDFNIIGSFIVIIIIGLLSHKIYYIYSCDKNKVYALVSLIFLFSFLYMSFLSSLLYWTVAPLSFIIFYSILIFLKKSFESKTITKK